MARIRRRLGTVVAVGVLGWGAAQADARAEEAQRAEKRPNIVVVMTDDQTVESMRVLPKIERLLVDKGLEFTNSFSSNPTCCPSRATYLTGQYSHNNGVYRNEGAHGGFAALDGTRTLPVWLERGGYATAHIGKYLNGYGQNAPPVIPPGWTEWYGAVDLSTYTMYGYTLNENGTLVTYGDRTVEDPENYQTDVYADRAVDVISRRAPRRKPFFLSVAPLAPHDEVHPPGSGLPRIGPPRPAPRHAGAFAYEQLPAKPSFNEADVSDKPVEVRNLPPLTPFEVNQITARYQAQLTSLLAVDDMMESIVKSLRRTGELDRTMIVLTSDNGFLNGEHRLPAAKQHLYEESSRVPLVMRGPGIPRGKRRRQLVANVDLAPTILRWAHAKSEADLSLDGRPLTEHFKRHGLDPRRAILLENWCQTIESCFDAEIPRYQAVRTRRYVYAEYPNGERELYDLRRDPYQLTSLHDDPAYADEREGLAEILFDLKDCAGSSCRK